MTHGCNTFPCPICHANAIHAAVQQIENGTNEWFEALKETNEDIQDWVSTNGTILPEDFLKLLSDLDRIVNNY